MQVSHTVLAQFQDQSLTAAALVWPTTCEHNRIDTDFAAYDQTSSINLAEEDTLLLYQQCDAVYQVQLMSMWRSSFSNSMHGCHVMARPYHFDNTIPNIFGSST